jgi:uncharacterized protein
MHSGNVVPATTKEPEMPPGSRALPLPSPETTPYWEAAARGELCIQRCTVCGDHYFYPRPSCPRCGSLDVEWVLVSGRGRLHSYLINHLAAPGFEDRGPYAIAIVELEEGPRLMSNIVGVDNTPEALVLDMELEVDFEHIGDVVIPVFKPRALDR